MGIQNYVFSIEGTPCLLVTEEDWNLLERHLLENGDIYSYFGVATIIMSSIEVLFYELNENGNLEETGDSKNFTFHKDTLVKVKQQFVVRGSKYGTETTIGTTVFLVHENFWRNYVNKDKQ